MRVLAGESEGGAGVLLAILAQIATVDRHAALLRVEKAQQEVRDGGLAGPARPDERDPLAGLEREVESHERRFRLVAHSEP